MIPAKELRYKLSHPWAAHYNGARTRCNNPKATGFQYYGGKGVKLRLSLPQVKFMWFRDGAARMRRPSIDRIDSDGDYCLKNCRFIEGSENARRAALKYVGCVARGCKGAHWARRLCTKHYARLWRKKEREGGWSK